MNFFKRTQFKLPKFPPNVIPTFKAACRQLPVEEATKLHYSIDANIKELAKQSEHDPHLDIDLAHRIATCCHYLLDRYEEFTPKQQSMIVGTVKYFAVDDDALSEISFASGLEDDAKIVNHVLEKLDIHDRYISFHV